MQEDDSGDEGNEEGEKNWRRWELCNQGSANISDAKYTEEPELVIIHGARGAGNQRHLQRTVYRRGRGGKRARKHRSSLREPCSAKS